MMERAQLDDRFERHEAVGSEPKEGYLWGRIHPNVLRRDGILSEARVWAGSLRRRKRDDVEPFVIFGRPRSGTTLLLHLLRQVPGMHCDGELMQFGMIAPLGFLRRLPRRSKARVYGLKLLSYQLTEVQRIRRPLAFFDLIGAMGYRVVHLRRQTFSQTLSLVRAQTSKVYFNKGEARAMNPVYVDPQRFMASLAWNERMLRYEDEVMAHVPHHLIQYESALQDSALHQQTVDAICAMMDLPSAPVEARMTRTAGSERCQTVSNLDELRDAVARSPLAHLLDQ